MRVFRLSRDKYGNTLNGRGAEISGGRWNNKGVAIIYTSDSRALCTTEIAVRTPLGIIPQEYIILEIDIPDSIEIGALKQKDLPAHWDAYPHDQATQEIGDNFINDQKYCVLKVPSVVVPGDFNYLINPGHGDFKKIKLIKSKPFQFDERLFK